MANIEIKDGEYTKTIYSMIKEQRYDNFNIILEIKQWARKFKKVQAEKTREIKLINFMK